MTDDPYDPSNVRCGQAGENSFKIEEDGSLSMTRKLPSEKPSNWKGAEKIMACSDDKIQLIQVRASGVIDYEVLGVHVIWRGTGNGKRKQYVCLKAGHRCNSCGHTKRLQRFREEHP